jgi:hypothetical protein
MNPMIRPLALVTFATFALFACTEKPNTAGVQDFPNTLQASASEALFDLPTSVQASEPSLQIASNTSLAKVLAVINDDADRRNAFGVYLAVPAYIHLAEKAKQSVQKLIRDFARKDIPAHWEGDVDSLYVKTLQVDSVILGKPALFLLVSGTQDGNLRFRLAFFRTDSATYLGSFFMFDPTDSVRIRVDFDGVSDSNRQTMTLLVKSAVSKLAKPGDPSILRVHAIKRKDSGRILTSGASYHPTFQDSFWGPGPKVYGFQTVSDPTTDQSLMRVAFADADSMDADFFTKHSVDRGVLSRATIQLRKTMMDSTGWTKLIYFCLDSGLSATEAFSEAHVLNLLNYVPSRTAAEFTEADLEAYLDLNQAEIIAGKPGFQNMRALYYLIKVKPPIFLARNATILGSGDLGAPAGFALPATAIRDEGVADEAPIGFANTEVEP